MSESILVTGGTGTLGRLIVDRLAGAGHDVRVLSRRTGPYVGNLVEGIGLTEALDDVGTVVHCASDPRKLGSDVPAARHLIEAARRAGGTPHLVVISIVGIDRIPFVYYRAKLAVERLIEESGLPWTTLRTTQFHDLIFMVARALAKSPVVPIPAGWGFQPVDAAEVAARMAELALGVPAGRVPDMGGPAIRSATDLVRAYLRAAGLRRAVVPVPVPGKISAAMRRGANMTPRHAEGRRTFEEFLAERVTAKAAG